jgi:hypothetical protein
MRRSAGWRKPPGAIYVGRPSIWGNPWKVGGKAHGAIDPLTAVRRYEMALLNDSLLDLDGQPLRSRLAELRGRDLACWCDSRQLCHADVLLRWANA